MIMNKASLEMLNTKLERPLTELSFRPNILVEGPEAFDEVYQCNAVIILPTMPGHEVIKLFSCSTQLSTKFILLINVKMPTISECVIW